MSTMPPITVYGTAGLLFALILSLDKRGILKQGEFITDLEEVIELANQKPFLPKAAVARLAEIHEWLASRQQPLN